MKPIEIISKFSLLSSLNHHKSWLKPQLRLPSLTPHKQGYRNAKILLFWGLSLKKSPERRNSMNDKTFPNGVVLLFESCFYST